MVTILEMMAVLGTFYHPKGWLLKVERAEHSLGCSENKEFEKCEFVCLSVCLFVCLFVCLSVCPPAMQWVAIHQAHCFFRPDLVIFVSNSYMANELGWGRRCVGSNATWASLIGSNATWARLINSSES